MEVLTGKSSTNGPFSIAMFDFRRVNGDSTGDSTGKQIIIMIGNERYVYILPYVHIHKTHETAHEFPTCATIKRWSP